MKPEKELTSRPETSVKPVIRYPNLNFLDILIKDRMLTDGMCVVCIDGKRGVGKTTLQEVVGGRREQLYPSLALPIRPLYLEMDLSLYRRYSRERSQEHSSYDFLRWNDFLSWTNNTAVILKNKERGWVVMKPVYMRYLDDIPGYTGALENPKGLTFRYRREIPFPNPLIVISGSFSHDPQIINSFSNLTDPIRILIEASRETQRHWIEIRRQKAPHRTRKEEITITNHDNKSWDWYGYHYKIREKAQLLVWARDGHFTFRMNKPINP